MTDESREADAHTVLRIMLAHEPEQCGKPKGWDDATEPERALATEIAETITKDLRARLAAAERERDAARAGRDAYTKICAELQSEGDAARAEVKALRQALQFYADENRYDYDAPCCPTPNNPGHKIPDGDVISDDGERAREALYGPVSPATGQRAEIRS